MKQKNLLLLLFLLLFSASLTACASATSQVNWPGVLANDETIYLAYHQYVVALDSKNGTEKWRYPTEADNKLSFYAIPSLTPDGSQLIVGSYNHILYSLDPVNGKENWKFSESKYSYIASPLVTEDRIYAPTNGKILYALDHRGNKIWEFSAEQAIWATPVLEKSCNCLYVAGMDHRLYAVQLQDGKTLWKTDKFEGSIVSPPVQDDQGILYFGTFGNIVHAFDPKSRSDRWTYQTKHWVWGSPVIHDDLLFTTDLSGEVTALNLKDGTERWKFPTNSPITASPLLLEDQLIIGNEAGDVFAIDYQGNQVWKQTFDGKILATATRANGMIVIPILSKDNLLIVLDTNGVQQWTYTFEKK